MAKIEVKGTEISIMTINNDDYISLTDMLKAKDGEFFISDWLRNRNTVEFLGVWERIYNPTFNYGEFAIIKSQAGLNSYKISVKEWTEKTNAIGLKATAGRYGGTYAHKDIAFEFGMWISADLIYASEADVLNMALFGMTAKQWRDSHPGDKGNIRDYANMSQLVCLSNLENLNALFIQEKTLQAERLRKLNQIAIQQMRLLTNDTGIKRLEAGDK